MSEFAGNEGNAQALIDWFNDGADGAINWCSPGDFDDCVAEAGKHMDNPEGFCNERHQDACGGPPGSEDHSIHARPFRMREDGHMEPTGRDQIIHNWAALTASADRAALTASYTYYTEAARARLGTDPYWALISQDERDKAAASGAAMPDGSYPITTCDGENSVQTAISAVGRGGADHDSIRAHIMKRADSLGCASLIPDNWNADGSLKDAAASTESEPMTAEMTIESVGRDVAQATVMRLYASGQIDDGELLALAKSFAGAVPPPPPAAPGKPATPASPADVAKPTAPAQPGPSNDEVKVDATVTAHLKAAQAAVAAAIEAQKDDPGNGGSDPLDDKISAALPQLSKLLDSIMADQDTDSGDAKPAAKTGSGPDEPPIGEKKPPPAEPANAPAAPSPAPGKMAGNLTPGNADGIAGDADDSPPGPGDMDADALCQNPDCGHMGLGHQDTAEGKHTGACSLCDCPGFVPNANQVNGPDDPTAETAGADVAADTSGGANNAGGDAAPMSITAADPPPAPPGQTPPSPAPAPPAKVTGGEGTAALPPLDPMPTNIIGPEFTIPVAWQEGVPTGDGRIVDAGALTWRSLPMPLMGLKTSPHDPSGFSGNDPAVLIGRIEKIAVDGTNGTASGHLLATEDGEDFAQIIGQMGRMGVSIDVGSAEVEITGGLPLDIISPLGPITLADDDPEAEPILEHLTKGEIMGITVCPFPAFAGAYIVLGDGTAATSPMAMPTREQASMAIRFVDAAPEDCLPCQGAEPSLTASGAPSKVGGPLAPPRHWFNNPSFTRGDRRLRETIDAKTGRPSGKFACPITVTADGQVFGHIAQWGVCHQSPQFLGRGECVLAPRSRTGYQWFQGRGSVLTAEGETLDVGRITAGIGHAPTFTSAAEAMSHYDDSDKTVAVVRAGEDEFGIWVAGSVHPAASPEQVFTLRSNPPSGDWRPIGGHPLELVAVLCVNEPGFPVARAAMQPSTGKMSRLVAAGVPLFELPGHDGAAAPVTGYDAVLARMAKNEVSARMAALRAG